MTIWPFIIVREKALCEDVVFQNHERIHLRQQAEMLVVFFYIWYGIEFLIRWAQYKNRYLAYRNISFEREAHFAETNLQYLRNRKFWAFLQYLFMK